MTPNGSSGIGELLVQSETGVSQRQHSFIPRMPKVTLAPASARSSDFGQVGFLPGGPEPRERAIRVVGIGLTGYDRRVAYPFTTNTSSASSFSVCLPFFTLASRSTLKHLARDSSAPLASQAFEEEATTLFSAEDSGLY
ncbi:hypothetical protein KM043_005572 [Ampulex compressa]|nr:hypothetical protein KM043_005572 [Ampulex compressa]